MDLIFYRGLNCHLSSIINIASILGINYPDAYSTLWSEKDFKDDQKYHIYTSKRVFTNLECMGLSSERIDCSLPKAAAERLSFLDERELLLIGMDAYFIPWNHLYQHFHESHYFFVKKERADIFLAFDPIYDKKDISVQAGYLSDYACEICLMSRVPEKKMKVDLLQEAKEILDHHPQMKEAVWEKIHRCAGQQGSDFKALTKLITVMINNRYLFGQFLQSYSINTDFYCQLLNQDFYLQWEGIKNGLYKAYILKNKTSVISEIEDLFQKVVEEEIVIAEKILRYGSIN